jgi:PKD repeat protein
MSPRERLKPSSVEGKTRHYTSYTIYQIDPDSGEVMQTVGLSQGSPRGVTWGSSFLWITDESSSEIRQIDPSVGTEPVVDSLESPTSIPQGITWDGQYLWVGGADSRIYRVDVGEVGQPNAPPNATFDYTPVNPTVGQEVMLTASGSDDSDGYIEQYEWDFNGDGISDARSERVTHTFESTGSHTVKLTVTDESGTGNTVNRSIQVMDAATTTNSAPQSTEYTTRPTSTSKQSSTRSKVNQGSESSTTAPQTTDRSSTTEHSPPTGTPSDNSGRVQRGFFSNGPNSSSFDLLANPLALTLGGFVFSAAGILLQLGRGG